MTLIPFYSPETKYEICIDEVGRGPFLGSVVIGAVVLPKDISAMKCTPFIKDSKKFTNKKKLEEVAKLIHTEIPITHIHSIHEKVIDEINILQAVYRGMHECIRVIIDKLKEYDPSINIYKDILILIDGDRFQPYCVWDDSKEQLIEIPSITIEKGDATYLGIATASIIAKNARDKMIIDLCNQYPVLDERYGLTTNMGYGTKKHIEGIHKYGITQFHRKTFGICKTASYNPV